MNIQINAVKAAQQSNPQHGLLIGVGENNRDEIILRLSRGHARVTVIRASYQHDNIPVPYSAERKTSDMDDPTQYQPFVGEIILSNREK